ncbi:hypothetical protein FH972_026022 [Carpinus fangiana]|uniref:Zn(2)-C6 fungal-type domain-containing protein n=1 Tax=Carpinus fangiana TaxID=176857 RepID=A0A5N6L2Q4_9ROSI|nr:hypothetical protein FH972_026022 [Carpinus fangiana]
MSAATDIRPMQSTLQSDDSATAQPASGFTAVNGRSPSDHQQRSQQPKQQSDGPARDQELTSITLQGDAPNGADHRSPEAESPLSGQSSSPGHSREDSQVSLGKRKRSISGEVSPTSHNLSPSKRYRSPVLEQTEREAAPPNGVLSAHQTNGVTTMEQDTRYGDPNAQQWNMHREGDIQDAQFAEALTRGTQQLPDSTQQMDHHIDNSADVKYAAHASQGPPQPQHPMPGIHPVTPSQLTPSFQKQRKRNFSNRTKTGCLTCRSRKKKCDEAKPTCKNCERGGFTCQGYSQTNPLYKTSTIGAPVAPLQAKNNGGGFYDPYQYTGQGRPAQGPPQQGFFPEHAPHPPVNERDRNMSTSQDSQLRQQAPYGRPSWPEAQQPSSYTADNFQPGPPLNEHRGERTLPPPSSGPPVAPQRSGSSSSTYTYLAQSALQHSGANNRTGPQQSQQYWTEKEKMLQGHPFAPSDPQLVEERKRCAAACHKFNSFLDPQSLSDAERLARFRQIIQPKSAASITRSPPGQESAAEGCLGERVSVEAPFHCEYGYNISIGDDTDIGPNCRIMDSCKVTIGARCHIGPNVCFYTTEGAEQPTQLGPGGRKQKRLTRATEIIIKDDVYITGNVVLGPGHKVGTSATIHAGTALDKNLRNGLTAYPGSGPGGSEIVGSWTTQPHRGALS